MRRYLRSELRYKLRRRWRLKSSLLFFPLLALFLYLIFASSFFRVQKLQIAVQGKTPEVSLSPEEVRKMVEGEILGRNIFWFKGGKIERKLKSRYLTIEEIVWERNLPHTVEMKIHLRRPLALLEGKEGGSFLVDKDGLLFYSREKSSLPLIKIPKPLSLGERIGGEKINLFLSALWALRSQEVEVTDIRLKEDYLVLKVKDGPQVLLSKNWKEKEEVEKLTRILRNFTVQGRSLSLVDLRFERPVVRY